MLTVLTVDLTKGLQPVDSAAVMTDGRIVYASPESLYVTTERWADRPDPDKPTEEQAGAQTEIHKFDISSPTKTQYRGSGRVSGYLLSQWSLSEYRGVLRVVSTESPAWWGSGGETESFLTTLRPSGGNLVQVGRVGGLGKGERVYSVRFAGDTGYVVTFRQVDPLFTLDLSRPEQPRVLGELKIPGYSAYLHPIGDDLLLGVGQDVDEKSGRPLGTQLSIFDVSDLRKPTRLHTQHLGQGWSEAEHDHHAFLFWPRTGLVMIPFEQRAVGFRVGRSRGIDPLGQVEHDQALSDPPLARRRRQRAHGLGERDQGEQPCDARRARLGCFSCNEAVDSARLRSEPVERRTMRRLLFFAACTAAFATVVSPATAAPQRIAPTQSYVVLYENGTSLASARLAVRAAGGFLVAENRRVGVATATSSSPTFAADLLRQGAVAGVARNKPVGYNAPAMRQRRSGEDLSPAERARVRLSKPQPKPIPAADPLGGLQWDMAMIHATPAGLVQGRAGRQARARRRARHGHRRHPSGHRPQLRRGAEPQLHRRHPADRRAVRQRAGRLLQRPGERGRGRSRHACRRDDRLAAERHRDGRSRPERHAREPASRPGLGLLLPPAVGRRAHVRR